MALPNFTMRQLMEAGVHFGHQTRRWNPKMESYLFGSRNNVHIIDLQQTVPMLQRALEAVREVAAGGGRVLFVGTKFQASEIVAEAAEFCGQYYVNHRWLGGMMTNWQTVSNSIKTLKEYEEKLANQEQLGMTKKEKLNLARDHEKLNRALGGIKNMGGVPDIFVVIDTNKESIAIKEANKLGVPVVAVLDSNSDPAGVDYPIPGNDDATRAIKLYCDLISRAVLDGLAQDMQARGEDLGAAADVPATEAVAEEAPAEAAATDAPAADAAPTEAASA